MCLTVYVFVLGVYRAIFSCSSEQKYTFFFVNFRCCLSQNIGHKTNLCGFINHMQLGRSPKQEYSCDFRSLEALFRYRYLIVVISIIIEKNYSKIVFFCNFL